MGKLVSKLNKGNTVSTKYNPYMAQDCWKLLVPNASRFQATIMETKTR